MCSLSGSEKRDHKLNGSGTIRNAWRSEMPMRRLPRQRESYPYAPFGVDLETMHRLFVPDRAVSGKRQPMYADVAEVFELGDRFIHGLLRSHANWTLNEIAAYYFVLHSTIRGDLVGVTHVRNYLGCPASTTSHIVKKLTQNELLESYRCIQDGRRKWLRLHKRVVMERIERPLSVSDPWAKLHAALESFVQTRKRGAAKRTEN